MSMPHGVVATGLCGRRAGVLGWEPCPGAQADFHEHQHYRHLDEDADDGGEGSA